MNLTVESASGPVRVRDRLPDGWTVAGGAVTTEEVAGAIYVGADAPAAAGETVIYFAEAPATPEATDEYAFGPAEYGDAGELWVAADGTGRTVYVVGVET